MIRYLLSTVVALLGGVYLFFWAMWLGFEGVWIHISGLHETEVVVVVVISIAAAIISDKTNPDFQSRRLKKVSRRNAKQIMKRNAVYWTW
jgi:hypothetical protein